MGLPARTARGFPGNLVDAYRAGIIPRIEGRTIENSTKSGHAILAMAEVERNAKQGI
jgi:hypothetical protein